MRRKDREISAGEAATLLMRGEYGILSTVDGAGQPYGVPLSYVWKDDAIYFHCAIAGQKLENLATNPRVSFCVVGRTQLLPDKFTTNYESAIICGRIVEVQGEEKLDALLALLEKYSPEFLESGKNYISTNAARTKVVKISIDRLTGKARR